MTTREAKPMRPDRTNAVGLEKADYNGRPTTLCQGCGHNSISSQIIAACYEMSLQPWEIVKLSGIGCSSKSPAYFLGMSHGFNALHGRMPSVGTGALMANHKLAAVGVSGDGDTGSIGMGQFKHLMRRNIDMVYIVENNGVYGLTKGQFSATADEGQYLKYGGGLNELPPIDICMEAIIAGCGFVARSFSGDAKQVKELIKAALSYKGTAVLDIISPCVTFNNDESSTKSYPFGKEHEMPLHDLTYVPKLEEIHIEQEAGTTLDVVLHDGSHIQLAKLEEDYDPTDKMGALHRLQWAEQRREFITGLIYYNDKRKTLAEVANIVDTPLAHLSDEQIRPSQMALQSLMAEMI